MVRLTPIVALGILPKVCVERGIGLNRFARYLVTLAILPLLLPSGLCVCAFIRWVEPSVPTSSPPVCLQCCTASAGGDCLGCQTQDPCQDPEPPQDTQPVLDAWTLPCDLPGQPGIPITCPGQIGSFLVNPPLSLPTFDPADFSPLFLEPPHSRVQTSPDHSVFPCSFRGAALPRFVVHCVWII